MVDDIDPREPRALAELEERARDTLDLARRTRSACLDIDRALVERLR